MRIPCDATDQAKQYRQDVLYVAAIFHTFYCTSYEKDIEKAIGFIKAVDKVLAEKEKENGNQ